MNGNHSDGATITLWAVTDGRERQKVCCSIHEANGYAKCKNEMMQPDDIPVTVEAVRAVLIGGAS